MEDEGVMVLFLQKNSQKLKKKGNKDDFEFLDAFDEGEFHCMLQSLAPSEPKVYSE